MRGAASSVVRDTADAHLLWRRRCDLGVYIDSGLSMQNHVQRIVSRCFAVLHRLHQCSSRLLLHSSFLDWTTATAFCLDFLPTSSSASSLFRTLLHGSSSKFDDQSILLPCSLAFTGCASQSAFPSDWLS